MKKFFVLILAITINFGNIWAQKNNEKIAQNNHFIIAEYNPGPIYDHRKIGALEDFGQTNTFSIKYLRKLNGNRDFEKIFNFPFVGYSINFANYGNKEVLGKSLTAAGVTHFVLKENNFVSIGAEFQFGFGYFNKVYDVDNNHYNQLISSKLSAFGRLGLMAEFFKKERLSLNVGASFMHWSNGCTKLPNLGINILALNLGLKYRIEKELFEKKNREIQFNKNLRLDICQSFSFREFGYAGGKKYFVTSLNTGFYYQNKSYFKYGAAMDFIIDQGMQYYQMKDEKDITINEKLIVGTCLRAAMVVGKSSFFANLGVHLKNYDWGNGSMYTRIGVNYDFCKKMFVNLSLKSYMMKAEFIELGIGWRFL